MLFSACETDRDDNPTYHDASSFTLNEPENRVYDLGANDTIRLTLTQPDYGYTAAFAEDSYATLNTTYYSTSIALRPNEVNEALVAQYQEQHPGEETIGKTISAYIRLTAQITNSTLGASTSNVVALDQVKLGEVIQTLEPPTEMYLIGSTIGAGSWGTWLPMTIVNGMPGELSSGQWYGSMPERYSSSVPW